MLLPPSAPMTYRERTSRRSPLPTTVVTTPSLGLAHVLDAPPAGDAHAVRLQPLQEHLLQRGLRPADRVRERERRHARLGEAAPRRGDQHVPGERGDGTACRGSTRAGTSTRRGSAGAAPSVGTARRRGACARSRRLGPGWRRWRRRRPRPRRRARSARRRRTGRQGRHRRRARRPRSGGLPMGKRTVSTSRPPVARSLSLVMWVLLVSRGADERAQLVATGSVDASRWPGWARSRRAAGCRGAAGRLTIVVGRADLDDLALVEHGDAVGDPGDRAEVVGDEDERDAGRPAGP